MQVATIIHSVSRNAGGLFSTVRELNQEVSKLGVNNEIFGLHDEFTEQDLSAWQPLRVHTARTFGPHRFGYAKDLLPILDACDPDLVHVHGIWQYPGAMGAKWARRHKRPYLISTHGMLDSWAVSNQQWKKRLAAWLFERTNLERASCLRALNEAELRSYRQFGLRNPVCVIPNGVFIPTMPLARNLSPRRRRLLYLGRLHPKKNLPALLQAWSRVTKEHPAWELQVSGWAEGDHQQLLQRLVAQLGLDDSVLLTGPLFGEEKEQAMLNAHAFVLPSMSEGLPTSVLEAWSYSLPVAMTAECNLPEGFAVGAAVRMEASVAGITSGLRELCGLTPEARMAMAARGYQLVAGRFSWPEIGAKMLAVYEWLLGGGSPPACVHT